MIATRDDWIVAIEDSTKTAAAKRGLYIGVHWDDEDGGIEIIVTRSSESATSQPTLHGRISAITEDDGGRFAWWRLAWQGYGGARIDMPPTPEAATEAIRSIYEMFRAEDSRQKGLGS